MEAVWDPQQSYQRVGLCDLIIEMHIGIADWERHPDRKQRVIVNVEMFRRIGAQASYSTENCINYDPVHEHVVSQWPNRPHTGLLETLAEELVGVCFQDPKVDACRVNLKKPDVYNDTGAAMVELFRLRSDSSQ